MALRSFRSFIAGCSLGWVAFTAQAVKAQDQGESLYPSRSPVVQSASSLRVIDSAEDDEDQFDLAVEPVEYQPDYGPNTNPVPGSGNVPAPYSPESVRKTSLAGPKPKPKKPKGPPAPYKGVFYDNDFKYLDDPKNKEKSYFGDSLKRMKFGDCWLMDVGGEYRTRIHNERGLRGVAPANPFGFGFNDDFLLQRTRLYTDVRYGNWIRFYGEAIDARSSFENLPPRVIEENRLDALNLFVDGLLTETDDGALWGRIGRQELLYGDQRLISPLDWANTRRTFDGAKAFWRSKDWDADAFWVRPVPFGQHAGNDSAFDNSDQSQEFLGLYTSYKGRKDHVHDFYYLRLAEYNAPAGGTNFDANLIGSRWKGKKDSWLIDTEGGYQFGDFGSGNLSAGFATFGIGHEWAQAKWKPIVWAYYDWASGDGNLANGTRGTFNQLFPLGHKYMGFTDLVARQNIQDINFLATAKPTDKLNLLAWWHIFHLDQAGDALFNANGVPIRSSPTGAAGTYVGQELDFTAQYVFTPRTDVLLGYSHFFSGSFINATNPAGVSGDVDFLYTQFSWRF